MRLLLVSTVVFFIWLSGALAEPIRLGWQTTWAVQGQLVMGLRDGGLAKAEGLDIDYVGFAYGAPLNQAALAGDLDILLTADQPAVALLAHSNDFVIVSRMMYNRVCIYVPAASTIRDPSNLAGKVVGGPIGAAAERVAARVLDEGKATDFKFAQLDMAAQSALVKAAGAQAKEWRGVDALFGFDPLPAYFEDAGLARMLTCAPVESVIVASRKMVETRRGELTNFLVAFAQSWLWYAENPSRANTAFTMASGLKFTNAQLDRAASFEPNFTARTPKELNLVLTKKDIDTLQEARDYLAGKGAVPPDFDPASRIFLEPLHDAIKRLVGQSSGSGG
jgi:ABC-type nitrate/sulfonate/bicarbonate transport system substrate-binding protein